MPNSYFDQIASQWNERADELGSWAMQRWVNRRDVWGRYLAEKYRGTSTTGAQKNKAITAPFARERGKIYLQESSLVKHFKAKEGSGVLGMHSQDRNGTSRWFGIDIDYHSPDEYTGSREANYLAATTWFGKLQEMGFDPLLLDSNGDGGYHLLVFFESAMETKSVLAFVTGIVSDAEMLGLEQAPDLFPGSRGKSHYGSWLRLPGRHHSRQHYTRVYSDEPYADQRWLEGHDAIDRMLSIQAANQDLLAHHGVRTKKLTVCLDFDGVIHSYQSGWQGPATISDPPIHKVDESIRKLRADFRVVVYSARCSTEAGRVAICNWLAKHQIEVDEVCEHKPPAHVYVDDRAVNFSGNWAQTIVDIKAFRK